MKLKTTRSGLESANLALKSFPAVTVVKYGSKRCIQKAWADNPVTTENVNEYFGKKPQNVAVLNGYENIVDVDCDDRVFRILWSKIGPKTGQIFGRKDVWPGHFMYDVIDKPKKSIKLQNCDGACIAEIRSTGSCTLVPPSIHDNGDKVVFYKNEGRGKVHWKKLTKLARACFALTLLVNHYPQKGSRHDFALGLSGFLLSSKIKPKRAERYLRAVLDCVDDNEKDDRIKCFIDTLKKYELGQDIAGYSLLTKLIDPITMQLIAKNLGGSRPEDDCVREMNLQFAFIMVGGTAKILEEHKGSLDSVNGTYLLLNETDLRKKFRNQKIKIKIGGAIDTKNKADVWLDSKERREYKGLMFCPGISPPDGFYNTWGGFGVKPDSSKSCKLFLRHLREVICCGDESNFKWFINILASIVQNPSKRTEACVAIIGIQGAGKSALFEYLRLIFSPHYLTISQQDQLTGRFNSHLSEKLMLVVEEGEYTRDPKAIGVLKDLVTNQYINIERKGHDVKTERNYLNIFYTSNQLHIFPVSERERRFAIFEADDKYVGDLQYFNKLFDERDKGGASALLQYLLEVKVDETLLKHRPKNRIFFKQYLAGLPSEQIFVFEALKHGSWPCYDKWRSKVRCSKLFKSYASEMNVQMTDKQIETIVGNALKKYLGGSCEKKRESINSGDKQRTVYHFGSIEECRAKFEEVVGFEINWDE